MKEEPFIKITLSQAKSLLLKREKWNQYAMIFDKLQADLLKKRLLEFIKGERMERMK